MIFFTSLVATTSYVAFGNLLFDYSLYFFSLGIIATTVGQLAGTLMQLMINYFCSMIRNYNMIEILINISFLLIEILHFIFAAIW
jgi:hypothetical protein